MPSKYIVRNFAENCYYHVFNRGVGVEKRDVFLDEQDYKIFKYYLSVYLLPKEVSLQLYKKVPLRLLAKNLNTEVELITYCLMPNHFHLLLKQAAAESISKFMKQLINAYTQYFNTKYQRVGGLFQGRFKAVLIETDELLLHISRYIHLNPLASGLITKLELYPWSSYDEYMGKQKDSLCQKEIILNQFPSTDHYKQFILDQADYAKELNKIKHITID